MTTPYPTINVSTRTLLRFSLLGLLLVTLYIIRDLILVVLTSIVIASFIRISAKRISRIGIHSSAAVVIMYFISLSAVGLLLYYFTPIILKEAIHIASLFKELAGNAEILPYVGSNQNLVSVATESGKIGEFISQSTSALYSLSGNVFKSIIAIFGGVVNIVLVVVISFYLSIQDRAIEKFLEIVTPIKHEKYIIGLWERAQRKISLWVQGQFVLGIIVGILTYVGLLLIGAPYPFILAILAAVLELVPFGIFLAAVPAISFAWIDGGATSAFLVASLYILIQQIEGYFLSPMIQKKIIGVSPLVIILSVLIGAKLAGFWGLVLAVPVVVTLLEYIDDVESDKAREIKETV